MYKYSVYLESQWTGTGPKPLIGRSKTIEGHSVQYGTEILSGNSWRPIVLYSSLIFQTDIAALDSIEELLEAGLNRFPELVNYI